MTYEFVVEYGYDPQECTIRTVEQLDRICGQADAEARRKGVDYWMVVYTRAELAGPMVAVGLGRDFSFLRTPYGDAPGDRDRAWSEDGATWWVYGNQSGAIPAGRGVAVETARRALRRFVEPNGGFPGDLTWIR